MKSKYSDSVFPFNIGISFFLTLVILLLSGAISGYLLSDYNFPQAGGIILLIIFVALLLAPLLYNRMKSPYNFKDVIDIINSLFIKTPLVNEPVNWIKDEQSISPLSDKWSCKSRIPGSFSHRFSDSRLHLQAG